MYRVLFYDVVCDKRRGRLHRRLKGVLTPVQKSAFEGWLASDGLLEALVLDHVDPATDKVRVLSLCSRCVAGAWTLGDMPRPPRPGELILLRPRPHHPA